MYSEAMGIVEVTDWSAGGWAVPAGAEERSRWYCECLEEGKILFFANTPFPISEAHRCFLLNVRQPNTAHHKNISYKPGRNRVQGFARGSAARDELLRVMESYSRSVADWLAHFLLPYAGHWQLDFASFRSIEEEGRDMPVHKRNDLLHVDAFPTRPSNGNRILRVFSNLNPTQPRVWLTSDPFDVWAKEYGKPAGLEKVAAKGRSHLYPIGRRAFRLMRMAGIPVTDRSLYDEFMLSFHHYLKNSEQFQSGCRKSKWEFPPGSTWLVFTDMVPHAVLAGRFALEQTFLIARDWLLLPDRAPYRVLEKLSGVSLVD
jgi:3-deoxy-D-manno-oct-2-ulosonic acid (Kdo) hydroxylase